MGIAACKECNYYAGVHKGLCGNCAIKGKRKLRNHDSWVAAREKQHKEEVKSGVLKKAEIAAARAEAQALPHSDSGPSLNPKKKSE